MYFHRTLQSKAAALMATAGTTWSSVARRSAVQRRLFHIGQTRHELPHPGCLMAPRRQPLTAAASTAIGSPHPSMWFTSHHQCQMMSHVQIRSRSTSSLSAEYDRLQDRLSELDRILREERHSRREIDELHDERVKLMVRAKQILPPAVAEFCSNEAIPEEYTVLKVVDEEGKFLGELPRAEALKAAADRSMDLILFTAKSVPPLCKIGNFRQHIRRLLQQHEEKEKEIARKEKELKPKEIRFKPNTGKNDLNLKLSRAKKFLEEGRRVKISVMTRNVEEGKTALNAALDTLKEEEGLQIVVDQHEQGGMNMISSIIRKK